MKKKPLTKGSSKAKPKALPKGKPKALTKGIGARSSTKKAMKVNKTALKRKNLEKLGKMTLAQKIKKATEEADTAEEAAHNLKDTLTKEEHSKVWSKHNVELKKKSAKEQKEFAKLSKGDKGFLAALHMVKATSPKFFHVKESVGQSQTLDKREAWQSEAQMLTQFGQTEFERHIESGRIEWRADPWTEGVWNYKDKGDIVKHTKVRKNREWEVGQEYEPTAEDEEQWDQWWNKDATNHLYLAETWGKGGGKALTKGKGKDAQKALTKGKGKGNSKQLAIQDGNPDGDEEEDEPEEEQWKTILGKAKRARDQCNSNKADCEAAMEAAEKAKRLTKQSRKDTEDMLQRVNNKVAALKQLLAKKQDAMTLEKAKKLLVEAGALVKEVKEETREMNQLANKAGSKASKR